LGKHVNPQQTTAAITHQPHPHRNPPRRPRHQPESGPERTPRQQLRRRTPMHLEPRLHR